MKTFTVEAIAVASAETDRLTRELDITNADHVALWLEANIDDASLAWLACRIVEAHEAASSDLTAASQLEHSGLITREKYNHICENIRARESIRGAMA